MFLRSLELEVFTTRSSEAGEVLSDVKKLSGNSNLSEDGEEDGKEIRDRNNFGDQGKGSFS